MCAPKFKGQLLRDNNNCVCVFILFTLSSLVLLVTCWRDAPICLLIALSLSLSASRNYRYEARVISHTGTLQLFSDVIIFLYTHTDSWRKVSSVHLKISAGWDDPWWQRDRKEETRTEGRRVCVRWTESLWRVRGKKRISELKITLYRWLMDAIWWYIRM